MTAKKPIESEQSDKQENLGTALASRREKLSPYQRDVLHELVDNGHIDATKLEEVERAAEIVWQVIPKEKPADLQVPDFEPPSPEEMEKQRAEWRRERALGLAAQTYAGSVPLGEAGARVGQVIVEAAGVIERYLNGNKD